MELRRVLSSLARQIELARNAAETQEDPAGLLRPLFHSLRVTFLALSSGVDPRKDASHLFTLHVTDTGLPLLLQGGQQIPLHTDFLPELFESAGIDLLPGQTILLESEIAKAAIEEALGRVALDQAEAERERPTTGEALETKKNLLWDRKIDLIAASLIADDYLEQATDPENPGQEAA
jgi:hypothetical protein